LAAPRQSLDNRLTKNRPANAPQPIWPPAAQTQQSPKRSHPTNPVSPIGLRNKEGICFAVAAAQMLYAIPELHMKQSSIAYNGDRTSCEYRLFGLLQAMKDGNKEKADTILKELLANSGCILGAGWDPRFFMENILAYLMREKPKMTQLFQMRICATSRPILDLFKPEERSLIISSGIPKIRYEHTETTLLRLPKDTSIQKGIRNWFHSKDNRYYIVDDKYQVFYSKDKKIETLPPYLFVETDKIPFNGILEELDLGPYTQNNQSANYELIGILSHIESLRGGHEIAYIKDGTNWIKFDNERKQQIPSLQDIEGKGIAFLYRRL
jgi:uncharacterized UBP type Zn finger protein